jgi:protein-tyrosine kinase
MEDALRRLKLQRADEEQNRRELAIAPHASGSPISMLRGPLAYRGRPLKLDERVLRANGFIVSGDRAAKLADELRVIKRPLLKLAGTGIESVPLGNGIMIASSAPGEGKTFIAMNLAQSMAVEQDHDVLLVDGDLKKQELTEVFGLANAPGFLDALAGDVELADVIHPTDQPRLSVVPAGKYRDNANELLASNLALELVAWCLDDPRRIVLFDTAPLLYSSEPHVVAGLVGQIVFVVRAGVTPKKALSDAIATLGTLKPRNVILNDADSVPFARGSSFSYGYYGAAKDAGRAPRSSHKK